MRQQVKHPLHNRDSGLGGIALEWISYFLTHGPGDVQDVSLDPKVPGSLPVDDEFAGFIFDSYAVHPQGHEKAGRRLYDEVFLSRAKGRAKSELAAWVALFEALGPSRFSGWAQGHEVYRLGGFEYAYDPGEAMGERITAPLIRCLATTGSQAENTFGNVRRIMGYDGDGTGSPRLQAAFAFATDSVLKTSLMIPGGGSITQEAASSAAKDGGKETFVVYDETHLWTLPENHRVYDTVNRNTGKRKEGQPWALHTSTMFAPGEGSIAEALFDEMEGKRPEEQLLSGSFLDHRQADAGTGTDSISEIRRGLIEAYGAAAAWTDLDRKIAGFLKRSAKVEDNRRYAFNQPTSTSNAWLDHQDVAAAVLPEEFVADGETITLGFDGSIKSTKRGRMADSTVLVGCRVSDGYLFTVAAWEQPSGATGIGWEINVPEVERAVTEAFDRFNVVGFYADPAKWDQTVNAWAAAYGPALTAKASQANAVAWHMSKTALFGRGLDSLETAIMDLEARIEGNLARTSLLVRHLLHAKRVVRTGHVGIVKENPDSPKKIDAAVSANLAWIARTDYLMIAAKPAKPKVKFRVRKASVY